MNEGKKAHQNIVARMYIARIRNAEKKRYAQDTWNYIAHCDTRILDSEYQLGAMAKQAVNMKLKEIAQ